jgi:DNA-binding transcriptional LysR family regulator
MDRFENARVFVTVVEAGGFARAAERLGLSRAAASKHLLQLEERLGARLLNRTTRRVSVTAAARTFYEQCRRILAEFDEAERTAGALHNTPSGELRVVAPTNFGLAEIGTAITDFLSAYPEIRINLTMSDRLTNPIEGGYDIAISVDMPRGASANLVARKLNSSRRILCAAPDYLRKHDAAPLASRPRERGHPKTLGQRESFQRFHGSLFRGQPDLSLNLSRSGIVLPAQSLR